MQTIVVAAKVILLVAALPAVFSARGGRAGTSLAPRSSDWCATTECGRRHTMCRYTRPKRSWKRVGDVCTPLTSVRIQSLLAAHNDLRSQVAGGNFKAAKGRKIPGAMKMYELKWDANLAKTAARWAQQCNINVDECRADVNGTYSEVRQNMWGIQADTKYLDDPTHAVNNPCKAAVASWASQRSKVTWEKVQAVAPDFGQPGGQLMLMMAGEAAGLGCGQCAWREGDFAKSACYCNYGMIKPTKDGPLYEGTLNSAIIGDLCPTAPMDNLCPLH